MRTFVGIVTTSFALAACSSGADGSSTLVGEFGAPNIAVHATTQSTSLQLQCGNTITIPHSVTLAADGRFSFSATELLKFGENLDTFNVSSWPVVVSGQLTADALALDVTIAAAGGPFTVHYSAARNVAGVPGDRGAICPT